MSRQRSTDADVYDLASAFQITRIEPNLLVAPPSCVPGPVYGGLLMGQAILAVESETAGRHCHSLQATFVRRVLPDLATYFYISEMMTGNTFSMRRIVVTQGDREVFSMSLSFYDRPPGIVHQPPAPAVIVPRVQQVGGKWRKAPPAGIEALWNLTPDTHDREELWMRSTRALEQRATLHLAALVYASDYPLLEAGLARHGLSWRHTGLFAASLNQSAWILRASDFNDWHLFSIDSPAASGETVIGRAHCFDKHGCLVAIFLQEAVVRTSELLTRTGA